LHFRDDRVMASAARQLRSRVNTASRTQGRTVGMTTSTTSSSYSATSGGLTSSEWTQQTMFSDLMQQKGLLIGIGLVIGAIVLFSRRSASQEKAARRLVRDWRDVDDTDDARDLVGSNMPIIVRPALLALLDEAQRQVHRGFRQLEREIDRL
jgi:hypothetical protein